MKKTGKVFKVYNAYERFETYRIPNCGDELCQMPIIEIGYFEGKKSGFSKKPKILITAGMDGTDDVSMSAAINFIKFIGKLICPVYILYQVER